MRCVVYRESRLERLWSHMYVTNCVCHIWRQHCIASNNAVIIAHRHCLPSPLHSSHQLFECLDMHIVLGFIRSPSIYIHTDLGCCRRSRRILISIRFSLSSSNSFAIAIIRRLCRRFIRGLHPWQSSQTSCLYEAQNVDPMCHTTEHLLFVSPVFFFSGLGEILSVDGLRMHSHKLSIKPRREKEATRTIVIFRVVEIHIYLRDCNMACRRRRFIVVIYIYFVHLGLILPSFFVVCFPYFCHARL